MAEKDLAWAIKEVMTKAHGKNLVSMGMGTQDDNYDFKSFKPATTHKLTYTSTTDQLADIYYWILDFMGGLGWKMDKIVDNFTASPGSGQFSDISTKATRMQEEGMKILGGINQVIKSALNLIYDLKEFEMRLAHYKDAESEDKKTASDGLLALKQIWLDNVDLKRGRGSIHQMAAELGYTTIREAFMMANTKEDLDKLNDDEHGAIINDQVLRILIPRLDEFRGWIKYSKDELTKRFNIEKNYLKSQVETIKLYSNWMKPYFEAAEKLSQQGFEKNAALVNAFSTSMFELQLMGQKKVSPDSKFKYDNRRDYYQIILIKLVYRGHVSQRVTQRGDYGYGMGGRMEMEFTSYALNSEELDAAKKLLADSELEQSLKFSANIAEDALKELKKDLDYFLMSDEEKEEIKKKEEEKKKEKKDSVNIDPFSALLGLGGKKKKEKKETSEKKEIPAPEDIKKDNYAEKTMRSAAIQGAAGKLYLCYDIYKKSHGMASPPQAFDDYDVSTVEKMSDEGASIKMKDAFKAWKDL